MIGLILFPSTTGWDWTHHRNIKVSYQHNAKPPRTTAAVTAAATDHTKHQQQFVPHKPQLEPVQDPPFLKAATG